MAADDNVVRSNDDLNKYFGQNTTESTDKDFRGEIGHSDSGLTGPPGKNEDNYIPFEGTNEGSKEKTPEEAEKYKARVDRARERLGFNRNDKHETLAEQYSKDTETEGEALKGNKEFTQKAVDLVLFSFSLNCNSITFNKKLTEFFKETSHLRLTGPKYYDETMKALNSLYDTIVKTDERRQERMRRIMQQVKINHKELMDKKAAASSTVEFELVVTAKTLFKTALLGLGMYAVYKLGKRQR